MVNPLLLRLGWTLKLANQATRLGKLFNLWVNSPQTIPEAVENNNSPFLLFLTLCRNRFIIEISGKQLYVQ